MTDYERKIKKDIEKLINTELRRANNLACSPALKRLREYALRRVIECRNMLAWLARAR